MLLCIKFMLASTGEQTLLKIMGKTFSGLVHFSPMFHFSNPLDNVRKPKDLQARSGGKEMN